MKTQEKITQVSIKGMHCNSCVSKVENALKPLADEVSVSLRPPVASLKNTNASLAQVNKALSVIGDYQAAALVNDSPSKSQSGDVSQQTQTKSWLATYQPLFLIITYILVTTLAINLSQDHFDAERWMMHFMAGFFLVFSFFKLLNIRAFANSYAMYDLLAMRCKAYGFIYPFVELTLGLAYLLAYEPQATNIMTVIVMGFSSLGVIRSVMNKQKIRCACLGTVFELPMSTITIIEDLLMAGMAAWMLT
jgi:cation transport ATPase